jgi:WD40 repeat protein/virulence-associated protein VagC
MDARELESLNSQLGEPLPIPIIGRCLQKKAVTALAEDNSPDAVKVLAKAVTRLKDEKIKEIVLDALGKIRNQQCIDAFCEVWADTRHRDLTNLLVKKGWVASAPVNIRVLSALKAKQLEVLTNGDQEIVEPLLNAFQDKDTEIANRASEYAISFTNQEAIDYVCQKWAETRDKLLEQLVRKGEYVAQQPTELRVLTALKAANLEVIRDGGREIVEPLLKAFNDRDAEIANRANEYAISLTNPETIDYVCHKWAETRDKLLEQLVCKGKYVARQPIELRVLTALKVANLEVIRDGGREIIEPLLSAFQDKDSEIANRASECATMFDQPEYQELLFRLVLEQDHPIARQVVIKAQYAPHEPSQRALFYFLTEQWDKYASLDYQHSLLQKVYELGDEKLRKQIADKARQAGRVEWIQIVAGGRKGQRLGKMTDAEWKTTLAVLNRGKQWEEMWRLAQKAPAIWSKQLIHKLKQVGCLPKLEQERIGFDSLKQLADKCRKDIPLMGGLTVCQATLNHVHNDCSIETNPNRISFSPDGKLLASYSVPLAPFPHQISLWKMPHGELLRTFVSHKGNGREGLDGGISFSPDGQLLASYNRSSFYGSTIKLWKMPSGYHLATLGEGISEILGMTFSPDGQLLASCSKGGIIQLRQMPDGQLLNTIIGHVEYYEVTGIAFSPDGQLLASCSKDKTIKLWQMPDAQLLNTIHARFSCDGITFSPNGQILAVTYGIEIALYQMPSGKKIATFTDHTGGIERITFSPDGKVLASSDGYGKTIKLWQMPDGKEIVTFTDHTKAIKHIAFSPDGKVLASDSKDQTIKLWSSDLSRLINLPIEKFNQQDREFIEQVLRNKKGTEEERDWLEFMQALMNWHRRFDVEVEDAPQLFNTSEFDIEIER